jgi:hypothetical protein
MSTVIILLGLLFRHDGEMLASTAPEPISTVDAAQHVAAARIAAARYHVDADLLLSIAAHESRYETHALTLEVGGKMSCGVMTPVPMATCDGEIDELLGYDAGARHLREWLDATHNDVRQALLGYAGGYRMIAACKLGPVYRTTGLHQDLCTIADVFLWRATVIRVARRGRATS